MNTLTLEAYKKADAADITQLFVDAFGAAEGPSEGEAIGRLVHELINQTRPKDLVGYVAKQQHQIVGCIFFSRMIFDDPVTAFILSPVAIHPDVQGLHIGQKLIRFGLAQVQEKGVELAFTYGDPAFYCKVGFQQITENTAQAPFQLSQPEGWLCQHLHGDQIRPLSGQASCVQALNHSEYW